MIEEMPEFTEQIGYNERNARVLITPARPSPSQTVGGGPSMADPQSTRKHSHNWKGGRSVASNGYVLIYVGKDHHLADVRGYAYEHRLVAEQKLGRPLRKGEIPHHINGVKTDNRPQNIEVVESEFAHRVEHRMLKSGRQLPHEPNPFVTCLCGCGEMFARFDSGGRPREYVSGHNPIDAPAERAVLDAIGKFPIDRRSLASIVGKPINVVAQSLSKLKGKGLVRQVARGVWERVS